MLAETSMTPLQQPAGYFSTFSALDPSAPSQEGLGHVQRRNRRVFVCLPCHQRKLRCNKGRPCSRCVASGSAADCVYQSRCRCGPVHADAGPSTVGSVDVPTGHDHDHGHGHGGVLPVHVVAHGTNFLDTAAAAAAADRARLLQQNLPSPDVVAALVDGYFATLETMHGLFPFPAEAGLSSFGAELDAFWTAPQHLASDAWLAQLFMVLALGSHVGPTETPLGAAAAAAALLDTAHAFLETSLSSNSHTPTIETVRALCMAILARQVDLHSAAAPDVTGLLASLDAVAAALQLPFESEPYQRVWVTAQILQLEVAMGAGTSCPLGLGLAAATFPALDDD